MAHINLSLRSATGVTAKIKAPVVTSVAPNNGTAAGGTAVTFTGKNFKKSANPSASLGGVPCTAVVVVNSTTITAVSGAHGAGAVAAAVTNANTGDGHGLSGNAAGAYTYT